MSSNHSKYLKWIKEKYPHAKSENIPLPGFKEDSYNPDVILESKRGDKRFIIEVGVKPTRISIVGASILADFSIGKSMGNVRKAGTTLIFVILSKKGESQIQHYKARAEVAKKYCKNLKDIKILLKEEFETKSLR